MTEPTEGKAKTVTRAYIVDQTAWDVEFRRGSSVTTMRVFDAAEGVVWRLATEAAILLYLRGKPIADILDGSAIPTRTPPTPKEKHTREREPTLLVRAVAAVKAADDTKALRASGAKPDKAALAAVSGAALAWAKKLDAAALKKAQKLAPVQIELAKLRGASGSLEDLLAKPDAPEPVVADEPLAAE